MVIYLRKQGYNKFNNIFSYRYGQLKENGIWNMILRTTRYARHYLFFSRLIKYTAAIVAFIETSATLVVIATGFIIAIPIFALSIAVTAILSISKYKKYDPLLSKDIKNAQKIIFIDAPKGYFRKPSAYLNRMANSFRDEGYTVIVVSHSVFNDRFLAAKNPENNIWVIKLNYYFSIKKKFLKDKEDMITYIS